MTADELKRRLINEGWILAHGGRHDLATHPKKPGVKVPIHRHKGDIPSGTLNTILKQTELK